MHTQFRKITLRLALLAITGIAAPHLALAATAPAAAAPTASGPVIDGFRTATFGLAEAPLRKAITADFKIHDSAIVKTENQLQRTTVLSVVVPDLVPQGGTATISYVLGYQTHKLIQVNIVWSPEIDPKTTPAMLYQDGESLQQYFASEGFPASRSSGNIATASGVLLFRATDTGGNAVLLILSGTITKNPKDNSSALSPTALTLAYAANALHPDVFQLAKGSF